ncbi:MazG-like family protein [Streptomyces flavofungini]|uniref:MazG-like family protein n=1 Tax=Streptomyces flavofungini TaxID=68200 RepID=A0ABS0XE10_9ACTN|nr:MazG-like family protein [Streptomyces flavofungini]
MPLDLWETVDRLHGWLESHNRHPARETLLLRMLKLSEEVGEVAQAVVGATGQNPRKGTTHTWDDVESELCDVVITALVALRTLTPTPEHALDARLRAVAARSTSSPPSPSSPPSGPAPAPAPTSAAYVRPGAAEIQERSTP